MIRSCLFNSGNLKTTKTWMLKQLLMFRRAFGMGMLIWVWLFQSFRTKTFSTLLFCFQKFLSLLISNFCYYYFFIFTSICIDMLFYSHFNVKNFSNRIQFCSFFCRIKVKRKTATLQKNIRNLAQIYAFRNARAEKQISGWRESWKNSVKQLCFGMIVLIIFWS